MMTVTNILDVLHSAKESGWLAADKYFKDKLGGIDRPMCGFVWIEFDTYQGQKITGRTKFGKLLKKVGVGQWGNRKFYLWNPSGYRVQNQDVLQVGAEATAKKLEEHAIKCTIRTRLD